MSPRDINRCARYSRCHCCRLKKNTTVDKENELTTVILLSQLYVTL